MKRSKPDCNCLFTAVDSGDEGGVMSAITHGADVNAACGVTRGTVLHIACHKCYEDIVPLLLFAGADPDLTNSFGETALHIAARRGCVRAAEALLNAGADLEVLSIHFETPLRVAFRHNQVDVIRVLMRHGANANADTRGHSVLYDAVRAYPKPNPAILQILLESEIDVDAKERHAEGTVLHIACVDNPGAVRLLLDARADTRVHQDFTLVTPLHVACLNGQADTAVMLIESGANQAAFNRSGETPLHTACNQGNIEVVRAMKAAGAVASNFDLKNCMPIHSMAMQRNAVMVKALVDVGYDIDAKTRDGFTALHIAVRQKDKRMVKLLLSCGADATRTIHRGDSALHVLCSRACRFTGGGGDDIQEIVSMLVGAGAPVDALNDQLITPLGRAICEDDIPMVRALLALGADPNARMAHNATAMHLVVNHAGDSRPVIYALASAGAEIDPLDYGGNTPLHLAHNLGRSRTAAFFLIMGANPALCMKGLRAMPAALRALGDVQLETDTVFVY